MNLDYDEQIVTHKYQIMDQIMPQHFHKQPNKMSMSTDVPAPETISSEDASNIRTAMSHILSVQTKNYI